MIIVCHRGWWTAATEKNSIEAFRRAFAHGYGCELDVRDFQGKLVISHDPPMNDRLSFAQVLDLYIELRCQGPVAINIKSDGLQSLVGGLLSEKRIDRYFVFDMSVPDGLGYLAAGIRAFTRQSEFERVPSFLDRAAGVWLDAFQGRWADDKVIEDHLTAGRQVALVSPELHRRPYLDDWALWRSLEKRLGRADNLMLCTDFPDQAEQFFHG